MASTEASFPSVHSVLDATDDIFTARERIVAFARACAVSVGAPAPSVFADDPATPNALTNALAAFDADHLTVDLLGSRWEQLLDQSDRRSQGAHFTPRLVADRVAALGFDLLDDETPVRAAPLVWDPACGGGAFLLAAARWLEANTSLDRSTIVSSLHASDIDPVALEVCDAALEIWSRGTARPVVACGDALLDLPKGWPRDFAVVIGNPPFLGQLTTDTTRSNERRARLSTAYAAAQGAYVDDAGLFVELAVGRTRDGGVVALVLPESILGARDATAMRSTVSSASHLACLWIDDGQSFDAAVDVVAIVLQRADTEPRPSSQPKQSTTSLAVGIDATQPQLTTPTPSPASWAPLLAAALGIPVVELAAGDTLGDRSTVTAGFRQHFYGIADAVAEAADVPAIEALGGRPNGAHPRLITSGAIEPLHSLWSTRPVKFAGTRWEAPVVVLGAIEDPKVRAWFGDRGVPKLLLASQTKIVEAIVDPDGALVPSVPVISVEPNDPSDLWHLAAMLTSPAVSAWMLTQAAGTGLSHDAIRLRASTLAHVPLPTDTDAWDAGARAAKAAHTAATSQDFASYRVELRALAASMNAAYGVEEHVGSWWWERVRLPTGS